MLFQVTECLSMEISKHRAKAGIFTVMSKWSPYFQNHSHKIPDQYLQRKLVTATGDPLALVPSHWELPQKVVQSL